MKTQSRNSPLSLICMFLYTEQILLFPYSWNISRNQAHIFFPFNSIAGHQNIMKYYWGTSFLNSCLFKDGIKIFKCRIHLAQKELSAGPSQWTFHSRIITYNKLPIMICDSSWILHFFYVCFGIETGCGYLHQIYNH